MNRFYRNCRHCGGPGWLDHDDNPSILEGETVECGECDGKGFHLTDDGEELLAFLNRLKAQRKE